VSLVGGDYSTITSALASITDASISKPYVLNVKNGIYNECNIYSKDYVDIIGESRDGVIIRADGLIDTLTDKAWQAGFFAETTTNFRNLTIDASEVKYCVHNDVTSIPYEAKFYNCKFIHRGCVDHTYYNPVGIGARGGCNNRFFDCEFESRETSNAQVDGVYWHNWRNKLIPCELEMVSCKSLNCNIASLGELASTQVDLVKITNCTTNLINGGISIYALNASTVLATQSDNVPFNIVLLISGQIAKIDIDLTSRGYDTTKYHAIGCYDSVATNKDAVQINKGYGIVYDYTQFGLIQNAIKLSTGGVVNGIALQNIAVGTSGYIVPIKKACKVFAKANTYAYGDMLKCNTDGTFSKTLIQSEKVAVCMQILTLSIDGLLDSLLL